MDLNGYVLTAPNIATLRRIFIRDHYNTSTVPPVALSRFNTIYKRNFISDSELQEITDELINDQEEELSAAYWVKYQERLSQGDTTAVAAEKADVTQLLLLLRLITSEVLTMMVEDQAFQSSILGGPNGAMLLKMLIDQSKEDVTFVESRTGDYVSVRLERE